ncbi:MAG: hypothetical protein Q4G03_00730 [Planctomycetia bacterium]|nr:hypothetical protein [Planctomycetia bacterium]
MTPMVQTTSARKKKINSSPVAIPNATGAPYANLPSQTPENLTTSPSGIQSSRAVDAFPPTPKTNWQASAPNVLMNAWNDAVNSGVMLRSNASACAMIRTQAPDLFIALFPTTSKLQADFCRQESAKIQARLRQVLGSNLRLQITCDDSLDAKQGNSNAPRRAQNADARIPRVNSRELMRQVEQLDVTRQIIDVFNAELADVKVISNPRNNDKG